MSDVASFVAAPTLTGDLRVHGRQRIRAAVSALLEAGNGDAWKLVYQSRIDYPRELWPYLKVYCDREDVQRISIHSPHAQTRTLSLIVVALIRIGAGETESIEDKMDQCGSLIEGYLTDEALRSELSFVSQMDLQSSAMDVVVGLDDKISHAELTLSYQIKYQTFEGMPEGIL